MPREWTEITVDEDLLIPVVRELLDLAANPNQIEVVHGTTGRVIRAEVHLAEYWFQHRLGREAATSESGVKAVDAAKVAGPVEIIEPSKLAGADSSGPRSNIVEPSKLAAVDVPPSARRVPVVKPSASPKGEES